MGNTSCTACKSCGGESNIEFNDDDPNPNSQIDQIRKSYDNSAILPQKYRGAQYILDATQSSKTHKVIRNTQEKESYKRLTKYFTRQELRETIKPSKLHSLQYILEEKGTINKKNQTKPPYKYKNGAIYVGQWKGGFRDGKGRMDWPDGASYDGEWVLGYAQGLGIFSDELGNTYVGQFIMSMAHGRGEYTNTEGSVYDGQWRFDKQEGYGIEKLASGSIFQGNYQAGAKTGYGEMTFAETSACYKGEWQGGVMQGFGTYQWKDGKSYTGYMLKNNMDGVGRMTWSDGKQYEGQFVNDQKEGYGFYQWPDNRSFEGWWHKGKQHGIGIYKKLGDETQNGLWQMGKRIMWFDKKQISMIQNGSLDYCQFYQPQKSKDKKDHEMTAEEVITKYKKLEKNRQEKLKSEKVSFECPNSVKKLLKKLQQQSR
ncbi:UNKNOWN [Stylonychia lemnae]|uniref:Morn repeat protein n=1 Tax=Stylonychia lemnae TaxID=5949 RepID=A0A078AB69_STYLE|nr:UNKNOWN [Stylonychia lemnae]|eukprot:CDW79131.1 UNKNOWN [Stylonychia lemnae]